MGDVLSPTLIVQSIQSINLSFKTTHQANLSAAIVAVNLL